MPTAILADDEPLLNAELRSLLQDLWPELEIIGEARDGAAALQLIEQGRPDISFLDIRMPKINGLELAERVQGDTHVVFVTSYDAHALEAFERGAADYLLKPVTHKRLAATVARLRDAMGNRQAVDTARTEQLQWIQASTGNTVHFFQLNDILYLRSDSKYTRVVSADSEGHVRKSMAEFQRLLDARQFWPINRGILVNAQHIKAVVRNDDGEMNLHLRGHADVLPVSKTHQAQFRGL